MFGAKRRQLEEEIRFLKRKRSRLERKVAMLEQDLEEVKASRRKWRNKASSLRRERRHLVQEIKLIKSDGEQNQ